MTEEQKYLQTLIKKYEKSLNQENQSETALTVFSHDAHLSKHAYRQAISVLKNLLEHVNDVGLKQLSQNIVHRYLHELKETCNVLGKTSSHQFQANATFTCYKILFTDVLPHVSEDFKEALKLLKLIY